MSVSDNSCTVLIIDDEFGPRESLRYLLNETYRVFCAESVDRGLELLREHAPEVVVLDIRMPKRDGIDGLRSIRELDPDVAIIMLTGYAALDTAQEAVRHEASDYMEKPFEASEMRAAVARHAARADVRRRQRRLLRDAEKIEARLLCEIRQGTHLAEIETVSSEFIHDLRNALSVALQTAEILRIELCDENGCSGNGSLSVVLDRLVSIEQAVLQCGDLLEAWQRLFDKDPGVDNTQFPFAQLVRDVLAQHRNPRGPELRFEDRGGEDALVAGDRVQLSRVIANLVKNAIQAVSQDAGLVEVTLRRVEALNIELRMADNGCGIAPENLNRVFDCRFTTRRDQGGTGLGLFIVRKIVEMYKGTLAIESRLGVGTTVIVTLPIQ